MASRYIPPHLRNKTEISTSRDNALTDGLARRRLSDLRISNDDERPLYTLEELNDHYGSTLVHSTLRDTSINPGVLGYVILFHNANPRWQSDKIIFAHTNIHILPGYQMFKQQLSSGYADVKGKDIDSVTGESQFIPEVGRSQTLQPVPAEASLSDHPQETVLPSDKSASLDDQESHNENKMNNSPTPIFIELGGRRGARNIAFHGYFNLSNVEFLKPQSPELVRMLQQKWEPVQRNPNAPPGRSRQRDPEAWATSMKQEWAILQFKPVPRGQSPEDPRVETLPDVKQKANTELEK